MRIIADDNIPFLRGRLEAAGIDVEYVDQFGFTKEKVKDSAAIIIRTRTRCDSELLEDSGVKLIATATIGTDQIDTEWCNQAGIEVRNAPGCNAPGVAQYVWSCLLRMGFKPKEDTLGIVGCGNVGGIVKKWGEELGAKLLVCDPPKADISMGNKSQGQDLEDFIEYVSLEELLEKSDAITLHTPLTRKGDYPTYHLIGERELSMIEDGKILINAARGGVIDFEALKPVALSKRLKIAIDTWEGEPEIDSEILDSVDYGTFHIAGYSRQGKERATRMALEAVEDKFGVTIDKTGLAPIYTETRGLNEQRIVESYDPGVDTRALREAPEQFDILRRDYYYRNEV